MWSVSYSTVLTCTICIEQPYIGQLPDYINYWELSPLGLISYMHFTDIYARTQWAVTGCEFFGYSLFENIGQFFVARRC